MTTRSQIGRVVGALAAIALIILCFVLTDRPVSVWPDVLESGSSESSSGTPKLRTCIRAAPPSGTLFKAEGEIDFPDGGVGRVGDLPCLPGDPESFFTERHVIPGRFGAGPANDQFGYNIALVNPYDSGPNIYDASGGPIAGTYAPFVDAGYAFFTQVVGSFTVPPLAPSGAVVAIWPAFGFPAGTTQNASPPGGGSVILQPIIVNANFITGQPWQIQYVYCCDANEVFVIGTPAVVQPNDVLTFEIMVDSRFPCTANGLGCAWVEGINDTGPLGAVDANFGGHYFSFLVPLINGPPMEFQFVVEPEAFVTCNDMPGGVDGGVTVTIQSMYEHDPNSNVGNIVEWNTLPLTPPYPPVAWTATLGLTPSGYGYPMQPGTTSFPAVANYVPGRTIGDTPSASICAGCNCDASVHGSSICLTWGNKPCP